MRKNKWLSFFILTAGVMCTIISARAQAPVIIDADECPIDSVGIITQYYIDDVEPVNVHLGTAGGPRTWDFRTGPQRGTETDSILNISDAPDYIMFPDAKIAYSFNWNLPNHYRRYIYWSKTDSSFLMHGMKGKTDSGNPYLHVYNEPRIWLKFPLTYGMSWADTVTAEQEVQPGVMGLWTLTDEYVVDAYGTIKLPYRNGEGLECLRIQWKENLTLSIQGQAIQVIRTIDYNWITKEYGIVARIESMEGETSPNFTQAKSFTRLFDIIGVEAAPVADFRADRTMGDVPLTVNFTDLTTGTVDSWSWNFGDGQSSIAQNPTHVYQQAGVYSVSLHVTGPGGSDTEFKAGFITVADTQQVEGWFWQNRHPPGNHLNDIFVLDPNTAIAAGGAGTIMRTTDGGLNWNSQHYVNGLNSFLMDIHFINHNVGWIVGWNGTVLKTSDGGVNWTTQTTGVHHSFTSVRFIDENTGWAIEGDAIVKTTDGGVTWNKQTPDFIADELYSVFFIDANHGWAVGDISYQGLVLMTDDGGVNWNSLLIEGADRFWSVFFINNKIGWVVGVSGDIFKTIDGGLNWNRQNKENYSSLLSVHFIDENIGWIAGMDQGGLILQTTNGGEDWIYQSSGMSNDYWNFGSVHFSDENNGWIVESCGSIVHTTDGGEHWHVQTSGKQDHLSDCHFVNPLTGWAVGTDGAILATVDGGKNWEYQNSKSIKWLSSVHFVDDNTGWVSGKDGVILNTTDRGANWNKQMSGTSEELYSIFFTDASHGWAVGGFFSSRSVILHTANGGTNWSEQTSGVSSALLSTYFIDNQTGWAVGWDGTILHTIDGGNNWNPQSSNTSETLESVFFIDANHGWIASGDQDGIVLKTTDGGASWIPCKAGDEKYQFLQSVYFINRNTGWAVGYSIGYNGKIFKTTDGGSTWKNQPSNTSLELCSVFFVDENIGWAVGGAGTILKTTTGGELSAISPPVAEFSVDRRTGQAPLTVQFKDLSTGDTSSRRWDFGDNQTSAELNPAHTYQNAGIYTVALWISGPGGEDTETKENYITVLAKQPYLTHNTDNLKISIFENGNIGFSGLTGIGDGVAFHGGMNAIFSGGIVFGTASWGSVNGHVPSFGINDDIVNTAPISGFDMLPPHWDQVARATYNDDGAENPYHLTINQISHSNTGENSAIIRYRIHGNNESMSDLYIGLFADWDIGGDNSLLLNMGGYDISRGIVYQFVSDGSNDPNYYGIVALDGMAGARVSSEWVTEGARDSSFKWISTIDHEPMTTPGDYRMWSGSGPFNIEPNDTLDVHFAIVAGTDLNDLLANTDAAIQKYNMFIAIDRALENAAIPVAFSLSQNYPNPFNPMTTICYDLPQDGHVTIELINSIGQKVGVLIDEFKVAGSYSIEYDAPRLPSGLYFYRMKAGDFIGIRKLVLIR